MEEKKREFFVKDEYEKRFLVNFLLNFSGYEETMKMTIKTNDEE